MNMTMWSGIFSVTRRAIFRLGLGSAAGAVCAPGIALALKGYRPENLGEVEIVTLTALMSRLIPADGGQGGAVEACAYVYLDRSLGGYHAAHLGAYREGLAELDLLARKRGFHSFAAMPAGDMDGLISGLERGEATGGAFTDGGRAFFNLVRRHTIEGFLSDPMYGGNKDFIGWEVLGYPGVQLYYSPETQQLNGKDGREPRSVADFGGRPIP